MWAYLLQGLWNLLGAETEPMLPVLEAWSLNHVPPSGEGLSFRYILFFFFMKNF